MRNRMIELLQEYTDDNNGGGSNHGLADHLLANGVIVPLVKAGQTVCVVDYQKRKVTEMEVRSIEYEAERTTVKCVYWESEVKGLLHRHDYYFYFYEIGKTVFLTREEAEKDLKGAEG